MHKDHEDDNNSAEDYVIDLLVKSMKSIRSGTINVNGKWTCNPD